MKKIIGILGATGIVGQSLLAQLETQFLDYDLKLFASDRSLGNMMLARDHHYFIEAPTLQALSSCTVLFAMTEGAISKPLIESCRHTLPLIIDNASTYRLQPTVPLLIPEINSAHYQGQSLVANPNCTTIQLLLALQPLFDHVGMQECFVSSYQSVSGSGQAGLTELSDSMQALIHNRPFESTVYPRPIAGNVIPQCDLFEDQWTYEELKIINESKKITGRPLSIHPTCVRVPVYQGHHLAVTVKLDHGIEYAELKTLMQSYSRINFQEKQQYPSQELLLGSDQVFVSRARQAFTDDKTWSFWISADNIRVGAATNALNIMKMTLGH